VLSRVPWRRLVRYSAVSAVATVVGNVALIGFFYFGDWSARPASIGSCVVAGVPSYYLNRRWVWRKSGRSHVRREVTPFWIMTFAGLALSTWLVGYAESYGRDHFSSRAEQTALVSATSLFAFGILWLVKFVAFERFMFGNERSDYETTV
jgi:putative flippase GtrA